MLSSHFCTGINELWHEVWRLAPPSTNANATERLAAAERIAEQRRSVIAASHGTDVPPRREALLPN